MANHSGNVWSRDELLVAFNLYCRLPFGRLHRSNPQIIRVAEALGRTPDALAMKLVNFASFDPIHSHRGVSGLSHASKGDRSIWDEFHADWSDLAEESQLALSKIGAQTDSDIKEASRRLGEGVTDTVSERRTRLVQRFFRDAVLSVYGGKCAMCLVNIADLLVAGHIIPWADNETRRADPTNGLCLCSLHDKAFDRGLIAIDDDYRIIVGSSASHESESDVQRAAFSAAQGKFLHLPDRFRPDVIALEYHRDNIFRG